MSSQAFGIILVNKPKGMTSHDVVDVARSRLGIRKIGHAGTLDPMATGLLILLIGRATKLSNRFVEFDKEYEATMTLGKKTTTGDAEGEVIAESPIDGIDETKIREVFSRFVGEIEQVPPMVSALRYRGKRLYELARKGIEVERPPRKVTIYKLEITRIELPEIDFVVACSKGTYIRKLCEDIGDALGCGAYQSRLHRTRIGPFKVEDAVSIDEINESAIRPVYLN